MARDRFNNDPLVQIPAGALAALIEMAEAFIDGAGEGIEEVVNDALKEVRKCATAQGIALEAPAGFYVED